MFSSTLFFLVIWYAQEEKRDWVHYKLAYNFIGSTYTPNGIAHLYFQLRSGTYSKPSFWREVLLEISIFFFFLLSLQHYETLENSGQLISGSWFNLIYCPLHLKDSAWIKRKLAKYQHYFVELSFLQGKYSSQAISWLLWQTILNFMSLHSRNFQNSSP